MRISDWSSDVCSTDLLARAPILHPGVKNDENATATTSFVSKTSHTYRARSMPPFGAFYGVGRRRSCHIVCHFSRSSVRFLQRGNVHVAPEIRVCTINFAEMKANRRLRTTRQLVKISVVRSEEKTSELQPLMRTT